MTNDQGAIPLQLGLDHRQLLRDRNPLSLGTIMRLNNIRIPTFFHFILQQIILFGEDISFGQEVKVSDTVFGLHFGDHFVHEVLAG
jgi:hypothetical protein